MATAMIRLGLLTACVCVLLSASASALPIGVSGGGSLSCQPTRVANVKVLVHRTPKLLLRHPNPKTRIDYAEGPVAFRLVANRHRATLINEGSRQVRLRVRCDG